MAFDPQRDSALAALAAITVRHQHHAPGLPRDLWLRGYDYEFIELLAPHLTAAWWKHHQGQ